MKSDIEQLLRRGFSVISVMIDPDGISKEPDFETDIYFSVTHRDFPSVLRFIQRVKNLDELAVAIKNLIGIYDDKAGDVWLMKNSRIYFNALPINKLMVQGTAKGLKVVKEFWGLNINEQETTDKHPKSPNRQGPTKPKNIF
jgi:hypothetical protein